MMKLMGSALIAGAAAFLGFRAAARLRGQLRALDEIGAGLELLERELELYAPELRELMERLEARTKGCGKALFTDFAAALARGEGTVAGQWERCVYQLEELVPEGKLCLSSLGEVLGRYDSREQCRCVAAVRSRLERIRESEGALCQSRCRTCQTIGLSGGAFLVILLL